VIIFNAEKKLVFLKTPRNSLWANQYSSQYNGIMSISLWNGRERVRFLFKTDFWIHKKAFDNLENGRKHILFLLRMMLDCLELIHQIIERVLHGKDRDTTLARVTFARWHLRPRHLCTRHFRARHLRVKWFFFCSIYVELIICSHIIRLIKLINMNKKDVLVLYSFVYL
jgi:hypothetical protein